MTIRWWRKEIKATDPMTEEQIQAFCDKVEKSLEDGWSFYYSCGVNGVRTPAQKIGLVEHPRFIELRDKFQGKKLKIEICHD